MYENKTKGWYGSYSNAGRTSAEKYHIIIHKDDILKSDQKQFMIKDIFTPDEEEELENLENNINIFKMYSNNQKKENLSFKTKKDLLKKKIEEDSERFKYHNKHLKEMKKKNKVDGPSCTRYRPNYKYIWSRIITGPEWSIVNGRDKKPKKKQKLHCNNIETDEKSIKKKKKCMTVSNNTKSEENSGQPSFIKDAKNVVNMKKQLDRPEFSLNNDLRIKKLKPAYIEPDERAYALTQSNFHGGPMQYPELSGFYGGINMQTQYNNNLSKSIFSNFSKTPKKIALYNTIYMNSPNNIKAPDFRKSISREQLERSKRVKTINTTPYVTPNYSLVRERCVTMAKYDTPKNKCNYSKKNNFSGFGISYNYDPSKIISKINNHNDPNVPNFNLMSSRPDKNKVLPSFMQQMYSRVSNYSMTDKSLELNNFANAKYITAKTSFWPKRSFNKLINLNLLKCENLNQQNNKYVDQSYENEKMNLSSALKLYQNNYESLLKEGMLNKFDNITFKTNKKEVKVDSNEIDKYLMNFQNIDD